MCPGSQVFDTARDWQLIGECIREALATAGIAATRRRGGQRAPACARAWSCTTRAGHEIWACPNVDSRAGDEAAELVASGTARRIYDIARRLGRHHLRLPASLWIRRHEPDIFAAHRPRGACSATGCSTGSRAVRDRPVVWLELRHVRPCRADWSSEIIALVRPAGQCLPRGGRAGHASSATVTAEAAEATGLPRGTPVVAGGADTQLGLVGIGVARPGRVTIVGGSFWQTTVVTDASAHRPGGPPADPVPRGTGALDDRGHRLLLRHRHALVPRCLLRCRAGGGRASRCGRLRGHGGARGDRARRARTASSRSSPTSWTPSAGCTRRRRSWASTWTTRRGPGRPACIRAIEESAAYVALGHLRIIERADRRIQLDEVVFTGGAAKGRLWPQIVADVLGCRSRCPGSRNRPRSAPRSTPASARASTTTSSEVASELVQLRADVRAGCRDPMPPTTSTTPAGARSIRRHARSCPRHGLLRPLWRAGRHLTRSPHASRRTHRCPKRTPSRPRTSDADGPRTQRGVLPQGARRLRLGDAEPARPDLPPRDRADGDAGHRPRLLPGPDHRARARRPRHRAAAAARGRPDAAPAASCGSTIPADSRRPVVSCARAAGRASSRSCPTSSIALDIEDARPPQRGAAWRVQVFVGGELETAVRPQHDAARRRRLPLRHPGARRHRGRQELTRDARYLGLATRICAELGAQFVKTYYCETGFEEVTAGCPVPDRHGRRQEAAGARRADDGLPGRSRRARPASTWAATSSSPRRLPRCSRRCAPSSTTSCRRSRRSSCTRRFGGSAERALAGAR